MKLIARIEDELDLEFEPEPFLMIDGTVYPSKARFLAEMFVDMMEEDEDDQGILQGNTGKDSTNTG